MSAIKSIEISFAVLVELTDEERSKLHSLVSSIAKRNEPEGCVHWLGGTGYKPWDDSTYWLETFIREKG